MGPMCATFNYIISKPNQGRPIIHASVVQLQHDTQMY